MSDRADEIAELRARANRVEDAVSAIIMLAALGLLFFPWGRM